MKILEETSTQLRLQIYDKTTIFVSQLLGLLVALFAIVYTCWWGWDIYQTWNAPTPEVLNSFYQKFPEAKPYPESKWEKIGYVSSMIFCLSIGWSAMANHWQEFYIFDKNLSQFSVKTNRFFKDRLAEYSLRDIVDVKMERVGWPGGYKLIIALASDESVKTEYGYGKQKMRTVVDRIQNFLK